MSDASDASDASGTSGIDDDAVIDVVLTSPDGDEYVLVLAEERPWDEPGVIEQLTDRVNRTVAYVIEGRLAAEIPEALGRRIRVDIRYGQPPTPEAEALFEQWAEALAQRGLDLSAEALGPALPGPTDA